MGAMIELRPSAELSEGELLFGLDRSESDVSSAVTSALSAALRKDGDDRTPEGRKAAVQEEEGFQTSGATKKRDRAASLLKTPRLMTIVLPDHSDRMPQLKKSQVSLVYRSKGFVPPHELVSQQDILASSLPADPTGASVRTTFRPGSVMEGKGRKLAGLEAVRFRNAIMRQTGFIEPDCADFSISYANGS
ncbi:hypothetical protein WJX75_009314 [Coccomyxa subellipsoidea]|uniref:Uncharacterized protein n=1 Tax=Coccomyxa subellipsoidea TaxID=248742 RepID=A0ABR2Z4H4_9CHLO